MAKRGRPSKKTLKKRKAARAKGRLFIFISLLIVIALLAAGYYMMKGA